MPLCQAPGSLHTRGLTRVNRALQAPRTCISLQSLTPTMRRYNSSNNATLVVQKKKVKKRRGNSGQLSRHKFRRCIFFFVAEARRASPVELAVDNTRISVQHGLQRRPLHPIYPLYFHIQTSLVVVSYLSRKWLAFVYQEL